MRRLARALFAGASAAAALLASGRASAQDLEAPPPMATSPSAPAYSPNASDQSQDSGLGLEWVYLNADVGGAYTNMQSFSESNLAIQQASSQGAAFGVGAGVRLLFFTIGARARDLQLSNFNLWELDGEAAFHIRIWRIDPYFGVRGGYAFVGSLGSGAVSVASGGSASDVSVPGATLRRYSSSHIFVPGMATKWASAAKRPGSASTHRRNGLQASSACAAVRSTKLMVSSSVLFSLTVTCSPQVSLSSFSR